MAVAGNWSCFVTTYKIKDQKLMTLILTDFYKIVFNRFSGIYSVELINPQPAPKKRRYSGCEVL